MNAKRGEFGTPFPTREYPSCEDTSSASQYLGCRAFPVSFKALLDEWLELQMPPLKTLRLPLGLGSAKLDADLQCITDAQNERVSSALSRASANERLVPSHMFMLFASHLDVYSSVYTELNAFKKKLSKEQCAALYDATWQKLLQDFDKDRIGCLSGDRHSCLGMYLWGEMFSWPTLEIKRRYVAYRKRSSASNWHAYTTEKKFAPHFTTLLPQVGAIAEDEESPQTTMLHYQAMLRDAAAQLEIASRLINASVSRRHQRRVRAGKKGADVTTSFLRSKTEDIERISTL